MNNDNNHKDLGKMLKQRRLMAEMTLHQLSAKSGVSVSYLGRIESGERYPSASVLRKIAAPLGISEVEMFKSAGLLTPQDSRGFSSTGQLDPYVVSMLSQEPVEIQYAAVAIVSLLRYMSALPSVRNG